MQPQRRAQEGLNLLHWVTNRRLYWVDCSLVIQGWCCAWAGSCVTKLLGFMPRSPPNMVLLPILNERFGNLLCEEEEVQDQDSAPCLNIVVLKSLKGWPHWWRVAIPSASPLGVDPMDEELSLVISSLPSFPILSLQELPSLTLHHQPLSSSVLLWGAHGIYVWVRVIGERPHRQQGRTVLN